MDRKNRQGLLKELGRKRRRKALEISSVDQHKQMKLKKRFKNQRKGRGQQMLQRKKKMKCAPRRGRTGNKRQIQTNP